MRDRYGINLSQKRLLINSRLSAALQAKGYTDFTKFVDELLSGKDAAQVEFILNKLTTNYTYFMREKEHFAFFNEVILPDLIKRNERKKVLSIWLSLIHIYWFGCRPCRYLCCQPFGL